MHRLAQRQHILQIKILPHWSLAKAIQLTAPTDQKELVLQSDFSGRKGKKKGSNCGIHLQHLDVGAQFCAKRWQRGFNPSTEFAQ